jgi:hypothetical protein
VGGNEATANGNQLHVHGGISRNEALVIAGIAAFALGISVVALALVLIRLDDYSDRLNTEIRLKTQAIDELRVEANVSRKLAGQPQVNYQEHD